MIGWVNSTLEMTLSFGNFLKHFSQTEEATVLRRNARVFKMVLTSTLVLLIYAWLYVVRLYVRSCFENDKIRYFKNAFGLNWLWVVTYITLPIRHYEVRSRSASRVKTKGGRSTSWKQCNDGLTIMFGLSRLQNYWLRTFFFSNSACLFMYLNCSVCLCFTLPQQLHNRLTSFPFAAGIHACL